MSDKFLKEKNGFCFACEKNVAIKVGVKQEQIEVNGVSVKVNQYFCTCKECGEVAINEDIENQNDFLLYEEYKRKSNMVTAKDIKAFREEYCLSQTNLAKLLSFGEKSIARYELGSIQDESHDLILKLIIHDIQSFKKVWEINKNKLPKSVVQKVENKLYKESILSNYTNVIKYKPMVIFGSNLDEANYIVGGYNNG